MQPAITMSFSINLPTAAGAADLMADLAAAFAKLQRFLGEPAPVAPAPVARGAVAPLPPPAPEAPSDAPAAPLPQPAPAAEAPKRGRPKADAAPKPAPVAEAPKPAPVADVAPAALSDEDLIAQLRAAGNKLIGKGKATEVGGILAKYGAKRYPDLSTADKAKALADITAAVEAAA